MQFILITKHKHMYINSRIIQSKQKRFFPFFSFFLLIGMIINSCKSFNYSCLPSPFPLLPNLYLPISITITFLFSYFPPYLYWYGGPHLISDFDFIISVYMLYILCIKCKFSLSIILCQFIIINIINNNSLNIKP